MPRPALLRPNRRTLLIGGAALGAGIAVPASILALTAGRIAEPFTLGVASGDPLPDSVVLWTRLAPEPLLEDGGMPQRAVDVDWEIATDDAFQAVLQSGTVQALPEEAHSVHVDVGGLASGAPYWYRFRVGGEVSPVGRTRTAPAAGSLNPISFGVTSCASFEEGWFTAYEHLAQEDLDVVFCLGDYLYEYAAGKQGGVRRHEGEEMNTLGEYRRRHAQQKTDRDLQAAHAAAPWIVTWDDHEVDNNYAGLKPENDEPGQGNASLADFTARRTAAYQAYWEHMPLRRFRKPVDTSLPLYRGFDYGDLARFSVLDTRQYRDPQPYGGKKDMVGPEQWATDMLGEEQHHWLEQNLVESRAVWNVVPQQIFFANMDYKVGGPGAYNDGWDGYQASRDRILGLVAEREIENFVVLTGDVHCHYLNDLRRDFEDDVSPVLGSEVVVTSVTSNGDGASISAGQLERWQSDMPYMHYRQDRRGYVTCEVSPEQFRADFHTLEQVSTKGAPRETEASFVIEAGVAGAQRL